MEPINKVILAAVDGKFSQGDSFRMRHTLLENGSVCTPLDKDPAMTVTRIANGWVYHCHRCHKAGAVFDSGLNPTQTKKRIEASQKVEINKVTAQITLPLDFEPMTDEENSPVPYEALHWLWKYSITEAQIMQFNIGWSDRYRRVILPLY